MREPPSALTCRAVMFDLDGTLYDVGQPVPGAAAAVEEVRGAGFPVRFVTNISRSPRRQILEQLNQFGIALSLDELFTATYASARWLKGKGVRRVRLFVPHATFEDFEGMDVDSEEPEAVVVGDLGAGWDFAQLNEAFRWLSGGAALVAIQKNRFWKTADGLTLDAGPFVAALEYASGTSATVVGKPSREFFETAARSMGLRPGDVVMIGDDVVNDVRGMQRAGGLGVLVRTGKFRLEDLEAIDVQPDLVIDSVAALPSLLRKTGT